MIDQINGSSKILIVQRHKKRLDPFPGALSPEAFYEVAKGFLRQSPSPEPLLGLLDEPVERDALLEMIRMSFEV